MGRRMMVRIAENALGRVPGAGRERGAVLLFGAAAIGALLLVTALVVDIGSARADRARNQVAADAAASAGAVALSQFGSGIAGCEQAVDYVELHVGTVSGTSCAGFPSTCDATTTSVSTSGTAGDRDVTIVHPVDDGDGLMAAGGGIAQAVIGDDGPRCERFAVFITDDRSSIFAALTGQADSETSVHAVARMGDFLGRSVPINLLLLDPHECEALSVGGGGSSGGIGVRAITDPATGELFPGRIATDSDGTGPTCGSRGTIHTNGSGAEIIAFGPPGCVNELPAGGGAGCGTIETFAEGTPGCNLPACSNGGIIAPGVQKAPRRTTRAQLDHTYNCKPAYPASYGIPGCPEAAVQPPYIDQLVAAVGAVGTASAPAGYGTFPDDDPAGPSGDWGCNLTGGGSNPDDIVVPAGDWYIDCDDLRVGRPLVFEGGNLVFRGDVTVSSELTIEGGNMIFGGDLTVGSQGVLTVNSANTSTLSWTAPSNVDISDHSAEAVFMYFRNGVFSRGAGGDVFLNDTFAYVSATSSIDLGGGNGTTFWTAPHAGPFTNLALWSESTFDVGFGGGGSLSQDGIFFAPYSTIVYTGGGAQQSVAAQYISKKVTTGGNGALILEPRWERMVRFPELPETSELVR